MSLTPDQVAGLRLWFRADEIVGLTAGQGVALWDDMSGLGNHAAQATGGAQPTYQPNVVNGLPVVRFNGSSHVLVIAGANAAAATNNAGGCSVFAYAQTSNPDGTVRQILRFSIGTDGGASRVQLAQRNSPSVMVVGGRRLDAEPFVTVDGATSLVNGQWQTWTGLLDWSASDGYLYAGQALDASTTSFATAGLTSATDSLSVSIGGNAATGIEYWQGDIAELFVFDNVISPADRADLWAYLSGKYQANPQDVFAVLRPPVISS